MQELREAAAAAPTILLPGLFLFRNYLDEAAQRELCAQIKAIVSAAPWFVPRMPRSGRAFSVKMTNCGTLGWVSDRDGGYRYQKIHPVTGRAWPPIPPCVQTIWRDVSAYPHLPEACLLNLYDRGARMGLHQDKDETELAAPVVSVSLGDSCCFRYGGLRRADPARTVKLQSGDVAVLAGPARLLFHGVDKIYPGSSNLFPGGGRINLTLRRVTRPQCSRRQIDSKGKLAGVPFRESAI